MSAGNGGAGYPAMSTNFGYTALGGSSLFGDGFTDTSSSMYASPVRETGRQDVHTPGAQQPAVSTLHLRGGSGGGLFGGPGFGSGPGVGGGVVVWCGGGGDGVYVQRKS